MKPKRLTTASPPKGDVAYEFSSSVLPHLSNAMLASINAKQKDTNAAVDSGVFATNAQNPNAGSIRPPRAERVCFMI